MSRERLAVLISGGLDSAILLGIQKAEIAVYPIYVRCGVAWEKVELAYLRRFLRALPNPARQPLTILEEPVADLYGDHWSVTGMKIPSAGDEDSAVYLPGRNLLLLSKAMLWCHLHGIDALALGTLQANPFPDATVAFFKALEDVVNQGVNGNVRILLPFAGMSKRELLALGKDLRLEHTFSCMDPRGKVHCGRCNKCGERKRAFRDAAIADPTRYA